MDQPLEIPSKIDALLEIETRLFEKGHGIAESVSKKNSNWKEDIRYTTFNTLSSVLRYARLSLILREQTLENSEWWTSKYFSYFSYMDSHFGISENGRVQMRTEARQSISNDFLQSMIVGLYTLCFSIRESRFRIFYNYLVTTDSESSTEKGEIREGDINKIVKRILCELNLYDKISYFDLFRLVRNTIHNNGVFTQKNTTVYCAGKTFNFVKGTAPNYRDSFDLLILVLLPEVIEVIEKSIDQLLPYNKIVDPFTNQK